MKISTHESDAVFLMSIAITMMQAQGGEFDEDDFFFADILSIGVDPDTDKDITPCPNSGASFGGGFLSLSRVTDMVVSSYVGPIRGDTVKFRLVCYGDDLVGASYSPSILELGMNVPTPE